MEQFTTEQKMEYVGRIDSKAKADNISIKHAARKLGLKDWRYWKFQNDLKAVHQEHQAQAAKHDHDSGIKSESPQEAIGISFTVTPEVWKVLEERAKTYGLQPATIAQIMLHDAVRKNGQSSTLNKC